MRLGIVRQRYTPFGGAERFVERAIDALVARGVHVRVYTRKWPQGRTGSIEPVICNPFYVGSLWRDASFAAAVRAALARDRPDIVQSHERIDGCDIFRAGDGVHRVWLEERLRTGGRARARAHRRQSVPSLRSRRRGAGVREPVAEGGDLHFADGQGRRAAPFRAARTTGCT